MIAEVSDLAGQNIRLAFSTVHQTKNLPYMRRLLHYMTLEDLQQEAVLFLYAAAETYKPELGIRFSTHAVTTIRWKLFNLAHRNYPDTLAEVHPEWELSEDSPLEEAIRNDDADHLHSMMNRLPSKWAFILVKSRGLGCAQMSTKDIAHQLGMTAARVNMLRARAEKKLAQMLLRSRRATADRSQDKAGSAESTT
jgi:RNA polymerase sigma factor (sigma-70 family)